MLIKVANMPNNSFQRTTISVIFFAKQKNRHLWYPLKLALEDFGLFEVFS
jgi:hypothetical protein